MSEEVAARHAVLAGCEEWRLGCGGLSAELGEQRREFGRAAAAHQDDAVAALFGEAAHAPHGGVAIHVRYDDHDVTALDERTQRRRTAAGEVPIVVLELMTGSLGEVVVKPLVAVEPADDPDVHGLSMVAAALHVY